MRQLTLFCGGLLAASFGLHATLVLLGLQRIDPVIYVAPSFNQVSAHPQAQLNLSAAGLATWLVVTAFFSLILGTSLQRVVGRPWWLPASVVFVASLLYLVVVHPHFLWVVLPPGPREEVTSFLRDKATPLYYYYFGNGFFQFRLALPFLYALLLFLLLVPLRARTRTDLPLDRGSTAA